MMTRCSIVTVSNSICYNTINLLIICFTAGPTVEPTMRVSILSSRDTDPNVVFTMSFNVTFGPPSHVYCVYVRKGQTYKILFFDVRDDTTLLSREVIGSYYGSSSQPDMTHVNVKVEQPIKENRMYECEVTVEGRVNFVSNTLKLVNMGSGIANVMITGELLNAILNVLLNSIDFL